MTIYTQNPYLSPQAKDALADPVSRNKARSVLLFAQHYLPEHFPPPAPSVHEDILTIAIHSRNSALALPRGHSKTTLMSFALALYYIVFMEYKFIVIVSESEDKAQSFTTRLRDELEYNTKLHEDFAPEGYKTTDWAKGEFVTKTRIKVKALGYGMSGRGLIFDNTRPDLFILDDLLTTENAGDQRLRDKFDSDIYPAIARANPKHKRIYVGTIIQDGDLLTQCLEDERWSAARYEAKKEDGTMLAPQLYPEDQYEEDRRAAEKKGKMSIFMSEYHSNPTIQDSSAVFLKENLRYFEMEDISKHLPSMNIFMSIDPAISKSDRADYTVITTIAVNSDNHWFILNQHTSRSGVLETVDNIFDEAKKHKPNIIVFETVAYQQALKETFESQMLKRNSFFRIEESKKQAKEVKIQSLEPRYRQNSIHHLKNAEYLQYLEPQLLNFRPDIPKNFGLRHDDNIDSLSMLNDIAYAPSNASTNSVEYTTNHYATVNPYIF